MDSVVSARWGRGAVGSAPRWHRGGRGFESHRLHQSKKHFTTEGTESTDKSKAEKKFRRLTEPNLGLSPCLPPCLLLLCVLCLLGELCVNCFPCSSFRMARQWRTARV